MIASKTDNMTLKALNQLPLSALEEALKKCCGSQKWASLLSAQRPFKRKKKLLSLAQQIWLEECSLDDWLEAFSHHPKIGDLKSLEKKFATTKNWSGREQAA